MNTFPSPQALKTALKTQALTLGFDDLTVSEPDLREASWHLKNWIAAGHHGEMAFMNTHQALRAEPGALHPGTVRVVSVRMPYLSQCAEAAQTQLDNHALAYVSRYALGRDYHKVLRGRLQQLAEQLEALAGPFNYRVFSDSAPVLEVEIARQGGLGWRGKHTLLLNREGGSFFFLGELFTDLPLPVDAPIENHCGTCEACITVCPTQAILGPYQLDARRCISYLTIELKDAIPERLRPLIGNRIYGCDDCQLVCPWNRFAKLSSLPDFAARPALKDASLIDLFAWNEDMFNEQLSGSAIRRIGYLRWLRNIAVALGNGPATPEALAALTQRQSHPSELVREHVNWALAQLSE